MSDPLHFRHVMGHFTTGVTVVTSRRPDGTPCGLTANSVASVSLNPPLLLVCLDREAASHGCIIEGGSFAICILGAGGEEIARLFSEGDRSERFEQAPHRTEVTGSPILDGSVAWLDCRVTDVHAAGDHSIVVGEVKACDAVGGAPLVFYRGGFRRMDA